MFTFKPFLIWWETWYIACSGYCQCQTKIWIDINFQRNSILSTHFAAFSFRVSLNIYLLTSHTLCVTALTERWFTGNQSLITQLSMIWYEWMMGLKPLQPANIFLFSLGIPKTKLTRIDLSVCVRHDHCSVLDSKGQQLTLSVTEWEFQYFSALQAGHFFAFHYFL